MSAATILKAQADTARWQLAQLQSRPRRGLPAASVQAEIEELTTRAQFLDDLAQRSAVRAARAARV